MKRTRTPEEILSSPFMTKTDIKRILHVGSDKAYDIFTTADDIDSRELEYRVFYDKVRTTSVCRVLGVTVEQLKRAHCNALKGN